MGRRRPKRPGKTGQEGTNGEGRKTEEEVANEEQEDNGDSSDTDVPFDPGKLSIVINGISKPFSTWTREYACHYYPELGHRTYRVPPVNFNTQQLKDVTRLEFLELKEQKEESRKMDRSQADVAMMLEELGKHLEKSQHGGGGLFIITNAHYDNYLSDLKGLTIKGKQPPLPGEKIRRGEVDLLVLHPRKGILLIQVKAVGFKSGNWEPTEDQLCQAVRKKLGEAVEQVRRDHDVLDHVMQDLQLECCVHRVVALPFVSRELLDKSVVGVSVGTETKDRVEFLSMDDLLDKDTILNWWEKLTVDADCKDLSLDQLQSIVGRYCGLLSTVQVWAKSSLRVEVRDVAEAANEVGSRFASIVLTPEQRTALDCQDQYVYLRGPPGTGKSVMLVVKARQWILEGSDVIVLNLDYGKPGMPIGHYIHDSILQWMEKRQSGEGRNKGKRGQNNSKNNSKNRSSSSGTETLGLGSNNSSSASLGSPGSSGYGSASPFSPTSPSTQLSGERSGLNWAAGLTETDSSVSLTGETSSATEESDHTGFADADFNSSQNGETVDTTAKRNTVCSSQSSCRNPPTPQTIFTLFSGGRLGAERVNHNSSTSPEKAKHKMRGGDSGLTGLINNNPVTPSETTQAPSTDPKVFRVDFDMDRDAAVEDLLKIIRNTVRPGVQCHFLCDEFYWKQKLNPVVEAIKAEFPSSSIWCAEISGDKAPEDFIVMPLTTVLRCPPTVQAILQRTDWLEENRALYTVDSTKHGLPTDGLKPVVFEHQKHQASNPLDCAECADLFINFLQNDLKLKWPVKDGEEEKKKNAGEERNGKEKRGGNGDSEVCEGGNFRAKHFTNSEAVGEMFCTKDAGKDNKKDTTVATSESCEGGNFRAKHFTTSKAVGEMFCTKGSGKDSNKDTNVTTSETCVDGTFRAAHFTNGTAVGEMCVTKVKGNNCKKDAFVTTPGSCVDGQSDETRLKMCSTQVSGTGKGRKKAKTAPSGSRQDGNVCETNVSKGKTATEVCFTNDLGPTKVNCMPAEMPSNAPDTNVQEKVTKSKAKNRRRGKAQQSEAQKPAEDCEDGRTSQEGIAEPDTKTPTKDTTQGKGAVPKAIQRVQEGTSVPKSPPIPRTKKKGHLIPKRVKFSDIVVLFAYPRICINRGASGDLLIVKVQLQDLHHTNIQASVFYQRVLQAGVPATFLAPNAAARDIALPARDEVMFSMTNAITGLERKVVVYIPCESTAFPEYPMDLSQIRGIQADEAAGGGKEKDSDISGKETSIVQNTGDATDRSESTSKDINTNSGTDKQVCTTGNTTKDTCTSNSPRDTYTNDNKDKNISTGSNKNKDVCTNNSTRNTRTNGDTDMDSSTCNVMTNDKCTQDNTSKNTCTGDNAGKDTCTGAGTPKDTVTNNSTNNGIGSSDTTHADIRSSTALKNGLYIPQTMQTETPSAVVPALEIDAKTAQKRNMISFNPDAISAQLSEGNSGVKSDQGSNVSTSCPTPPSTQLHGGQSGTRCAQINLENSPENQGFSTSKDGQTDARKADDHKGTEKKSESEVTESNTDATSTENQKGPTGKPVNEGTKPNLDHTKSSRVPLHLDFSSCIEFSQSAQPNAVADTCETTQSHTAENVVPNLSETVGQKSDTVTEDLLVDGKTKKIGSRKASLSEEDWGKIDERMLRQNKMGMFYAASRCLSVFVLIIP